ncbi:interleukin-15 receptor subunit alpha isoform X7 [Mugil cephalus]|uniref:interleukin-15 receptor subunit alpha isoform X7 n=1 Tax=Mugil cephalus TaxID=48193 RepID=UPI001FB80254|nr:interleukin-15 receptor subunit alpha isoform X7 [Mugil cephalus]
MDPGSLSLPAAMVLMVVLLGAAPLSSADQQSCTCPEIVQLPYTQPPEQKCYRVGNTYRYKCVEGRVRTAGTSDFIRCEQKDNGVQWTTPSLVCKPDPKLQTTTTPPTRTVETSPKRNATQSPENTISNSLGNITHPSTITVPVNPMTTVSNQTNQNSTHSMETSTHEAQKAIAQAAGISGFILIICVVILILFVLYRRRSQNNTPQATAEEQVPMNSQGGGRGPGA